MWMVVLYKPFFKYQGDVDGCFIQTFFVPYMGQILVLRGVNDDFLFGQC